MNINYETCTNWRDAFNNPNNTDELKKEYRKLVKIYHSDEATGRKEIFENITSLYQQGKEFFRLANGVTTKEKYIRFMDSHSKKEVMFPYIFEDKFEDFSIYFGYKKIAIVMESSREKLYNNFLLQLKDFRYPNDEVRKRFIRLLPDIETTAISEKGNYCIVINKTNEIIPLYKIIGVDFKDKYRHYVWIVNRLYDLECLLEYNGKVFNAFNTRNIYLSPDYHSVLLLSGWQFCTDEESKMVGTTKDIYDIMSIKCKDTKKSERITDLESIKMIGRTLFAKDAPKEFREFFEQASTGSPMGDWDIWDSCINKVYGTKRVFINWEGPLVEAFKTN